LVWGDVRGASTPQRLRYLVPGPEQAASDRALANAQRPGRLPIGHARDVHGEEDVPELGGQRANRSDHLPLVISGGVAIPRRKVEPFRVPSGGLWTTGCRAMARDEGVSHHSEEIAEVIVVAEPSRAGENAGVGLLHEVLGVLSRAA